MNFELINGADLTGVENRGRVKGSTNASSKLRDEAVKRGAAYVDDEGIKVKDAASHVIGQFGLNITTRYMVGLISQYRSKNTLT